MNILITGGAGFIGSNFIRYILTKYKNYKIINLDKLTYAGNLDNLKDIEKKYSKRYQFFKGDICDEKIVNKLTKKVDAIINFAAETHVDRSIHHTHQEDFIKTDIFGTYTLLQAVRAHKNIEKFIQISTDEVYGDIKEGEYSKETSILNPSSPYSASKAGGELQVLAYIRTYNVPAIITRCSNNYGPFMHPEKIIPLFITNLIEGKKVPIYGKGDQIRDWLHVEDHCRAIDLILHKGKLNKIYNIGACHKEEITNLKLTKTILKFFNKNDSFIEYKNDRPGHDKRYALDCGKIKKLGFKPIYSYEKGLKETVEWYKKNTDWWQKIKKGRNFVNYYKKQYS